MQKIFFLDHFRLDRTVLWLFRGSCTTLDDPGNWSTPATSRVPVTSARHQCPVPVTGVRRPSLAPVTDLASARHRAHQRPSPSTPALVTSASYQRPASVTVHARACHQRPSPAHRQCPSPVPPTPVTSVTSARHRACQRLSSCPTLVIAPDRARARPPLHPNIFSRVPPSHPTLEHFPDSFLVF
ncbi:hypothetical protein CRG98_004214 [Punica granatum]|uniref:Uncharacterized protein n=1 Tax=Punica granatum TaxID=22663 RepID=A0A2I0L3U2_PUNGR|nr:hypothetical protein CRG98_004214 [Punica granatum]